MRGAAVLRHCLTHERGPRNPGGGSPVTASRRRILARTRLDFWLDAVLLVAYTLAYSLGFTGIATHEWLGIGLGSGPRRAPSREALLRMEQIKAGVIRVHSDNGFDLADTGNLIRTFEIEAVLAAVVTMVSAIRRRSRRCGVRPPRRRAAAEGAQRVL